MDDAFIGHDAAFTDVTGRTPQLVEVAAVDAHEGPVYRELDEALYFTSLPVPGRGSRIGRIQLDAHRFPVAADAVTGVPAPATMPNGMTLGHDGRLIVCEQGSSTRPACISAVDPVTATRSVIIDGWRGRNLNSPNDVVVGPDGAIWFTDPSYGHVQGFRPKPQVGDFVYRWDPGTGRTEVVADGFDKPNGITLSPDGRQLYVTDSGANQAPGSFHVDRPHHVVVFDIVDGHRLAGRRLFAVTAPGFPDGLKVDADGRVYVSATSGVLVYSPDAVLLGEIRLPGAVNFAFGGPDRNLLFITADNAVWAAVLATTGPVPETLVRSTTGALT